MNLLFTSCFFIRKKIRMILIFCYNYILRVTSFDLMHYRIETKNKLKNFLLVNLNISFLKI